MFKCEFCEHSYANQAILNSHKKTAKFCLKIQNKETHKESDKEIIKESDKESIKKSDKESIKKSDKEDKYDLLLKRIELLEKQNLEYERRLEEQNKEYARKFQMLNIKVGVQNKQINDLDESLDNILSKPMVTHNTTNSNNRITNNVTTYNNNISIKIDELPIVANMLNSIKFGGLNKYEYISDKITRVIENLSDKLNEAKALLTENEETEESYGTCIPLKDEDDDDDEDDEDDDEDDDDDDEDDDEDDEKE